MHIRLIVSYIQTAHDRFDDTPVIELSLENAIFYIVT